MSVLTVPTINGEVQETVYNIDNFPYDRQRYNPTVSRKRVQYYNIACAFDIESTTIDGKKDSTKHYISNPYGFMYHWQFCIIDTVVFGRTWEDFILFLERLQEGMELSTNRKLVIYVHNLSYEFQFIKDFLTITSLFAKDKRKVMKFQTEFFEFRCSYFLSNMSLAKFCENSELCTYYKMVDTYDYKKIRTPTTPLTNDELAYCYIDVRGLCQCIDTMLIDDTIITIPLTNTGFVRREFRKSMKTEKNRTQFLKTALNETEYLMLRRAFRGGNTHASRFYSNKILDDVFSYDISSSYPATMETDDFPIGKFTAVTLNTQQKLDEYCNNYCVVLEIEVFDIKLKDNISIPYIDIAHCTKSSNIINDNGRVLQADYITLTLTNIDLTIIRNTYDFEGFNVFSAMYSIKGKLPLEFRMKLMDFYATKTQLKDVDGKEYEYAKSKNKVNSSFGMCVTAIDHSEILYIDNQWSEEKPNTAEALEKYYSNRNNFLSYQWGVFITANARKHLQDLIDLVNTDIVYIDTDSIKFINKDNCQYFETANERLQAIAHNNDISAYASDIKGIIRYLGVWDFDGHYKQFKTLGAKKYCYISTDKKTNKDKFSVTVSGMAKIKGAKEVKSMKNFVIGKTFKNIGRTTSWYNEEKIHQITVENTTFTTASNIGIVDTTYTLGVTDEYFDVLKDYIDISDYM